MVYNISIKVIQRNLDVHYIKNNITEKNARVCKKVFKKDIK